MYIDLENLSFMRWHGARAHFDQNVDPKNHKTNGNPTQTPFPLRWQSLPGRFVVTFHVAHSVVRVW